jgi:hypothetical protein
VIKDGEDIHVMKEHVQMIVMVMDNAILEFVIVKMVGLAQIAILESV